MKDIKYSFTNPVIVPSKWNGSKKNDTVIMTVFTITRDSKSESFEYCQGMGHLIKPEQQLWGVKKPKKMESMNKDNIFRVYDNQSLIGWTEFKKENVLHCLFIDAQCASESFQDFCDNLGYSSDSIQALNVYQACQKELDKLRNVLGEDFNQLKEEIEALEL